MSARQPGAADSVERALAHHQAAGLIRSYERLATATAPRWRIVWTPFTHPDSGVYGIAEAQAICAALASAQHAPGRAQ